MKVKFLVICACALVLTSCKQKELDTKLIASKYYKGVVKVLLFDSELEKAKPGKGYLGRGSGFIVTDDGYIFTNRHVVEKCVKGYIDYDYYNSNKKKSSKVALYSDAIVNNKNLIKAYRVGYTTPIIQVFNSNNETDYTLYRAEVIAIGEGAYDGALLKIVSDFDGKPIKEKFTTVPIGNSDNVSQGEQLCVFGFPQQIKGSASVMFKDMSTLSIGIMSGLDYNFNADYGYLKTDAEIHPGNSGGPVFNEENKVIGIATAYGKATGIGLVGGINGMYYISAIDSKAHSKLIEKGLTLPKRSASINTTRGTKQPIKTVAQINALVEARKPKKITYKIPTKKNNVDYYKNSKVFFANVSTKQNNNKKPSVSQRHTKFSMDPKNKGGKIWVYIDNYITPLNTDQIKVYIDKMSANGTYKKYKNLVYNVSKTSYYTYFSYDFYEAGKYKIYAYSKENKYINSNVVELYFKK
ncbi:S1C family serine protease [Gelatiniphilus marinus]|uniref:S1C family serine protease n=1 Tax=Gelatiniphilus marinus TaxID=1759464 RepID=A0ABW5JWC1_9FLAO